MAFLSMRYEDDIYGYIAHRLRDLVPDSITTISSYDPQTGTAYTEAIAGLGAVADRIYGLLAGRYDLRAHHKLTDLAYQGMSTGQIHRVPSLYEQLLREVPQSVTRVIERTLNLGELYSMGFVCQGELFGMAVLGLRRGSPPLPPPTFEAFINQSAVALMRRRAELAVRQSEERYRSVMEQAGDAIVLLDDQLRITDLNPRATELVGYTREQILQSNLNDYLDAEDVKENPFPLDELRAGRPIAEKRRVRRADGSTLLVEGHAHALSDGRVVLIAHDITEQHELERAMLDITGRERQRIGQDLHDTLGQQLTAIRFFSESLQRSLERSSHPGRGDAARITEMLSAATRELRRISNGLLPVALEWQGLATALGQLSQETAQLPGIACDCVVEREERTPPVWVAVHLCQIARESIHNALEHGHARHIAIRLSIGPRRGRLVVEDNGRGFPARARRGGMGLKIMTHRAELIGGTLRVAAREHGGTRITCTFDADPPA